MSDAPLLPLVQRDKGRSVAHLRALPGGRLRRSLTSVGAVEIVAPDRYCAQLLVDQAPPALRARIMPSAAWIVGSSRWRRKETGLSSSSRSSRSG